jgi:hypothetical protein
MPIYRDSENAYSLTFVDASGQADDVSARNFRMEFYQNGAKLVTLAMDDGIEFSTDGTDGIVNITLTKARTNLLCPGQVRVLLFDDSGSDPVLTHEGSDSVEGEGYDA